MDYLNAAKGKLSETAQNMSEGARTLAASASNTVSGLQTNVDAAKSSISNTVSDFSSRSVLDAGNEYLSANEMVAKFAFLIVVLIGSMILFSLGTALLTYLFSPNTSPYLVKGMLSGTSSQTLGQNPNDSSSVVIYKSNNQASGIEFTWSAWLFIDQLGEQRPSGVPGNKYSHIFNKGTDDYLKNTSGVVNMADVGVAQTNNAPGLYIDDNINELLFIMNVNGPSGYSPDLRLTIENVPLKKWFNVIIRLQNKVADAYINGTIVKRMAFEISIPKQNYDNVYICQNGGFAGSISNLRYFDHALSIFEINNMISRGPNLSSSSLSTTSTSIYDYLSNTWYESQWASNK